MALTAYAAAGVTDVLVLDGEEFDEPCILANGQTWSIEQAMSNPIEHPNAIMAGTRVLSLGDIHRAWRARWNGPLTKLRTAAGYDLSIGPNHPMLTKRGWIPAKFLCVGDYVISRRWADNTGNDVANQDLKNVEAMIEDVFDSLSAIGLTTITAAAPTHFHGDGNFCEGDVDVVRPTRLLKRVGDVPIVQEARQGERMFTDSDLVALACEGTEFAFPDAMLATASGDMGGLCLGSSLCGRESGVTQELSVGQAARYLEVSGPSASLNARHMESPSDLVLSEHLHEVEPPNDSIWRAPPNLDTASMKTTVEGFVPDSCLVSEFRDRLALNVAFDEVVEVRNVDSFVGHAFDLSTESGTYFANGILAHNCQRSFLPLGADGMQLAAKRSRQIAPLPFTPNPEEGT
jgi:hypothetical protein